MGVSTEGARKFCLCPRASSELHPEQSPHSELCVRVGRGTQPQQEAAQQPKLHLGDAAVCEPRCVRGERWRIRLIVSLGQETAWEHPDLDQKGKAPGEQSTGPCPCSSITSQDLCSLPLNSCPSRGLQTKSQPPPGLPFPGCMRNSGSRPRTTLRPSRAVMVTTNAQQTPALRNRNLTCSTRPRGQPSSRGSAPPHPALPVCHCLAPWALQPQGQLKLLQKSCPHVQLLLHLLLARSIQDPTLPTAAKSCWVLQLILPGSCLELSAGSRARHLLWWGAAGQAKDEAVPSSRFNHPPLCGSSYSLVLITETAYSSSPPFCRWDHTPGSLMACREVEILTSQPGTVTSDPLHFGICFHIV